MRPVRVAVAGSVDDGKSTFLGRLMSDAQRLFVDEIEAVRRASRAEELNLAFFTDGLTVEREQGITLDVAWRHLVLGSKRLLLADVPGHAELVRNMATGASTADAAVLLVDAVRGVQPQTRRHLVMLAGLGVKTVIACLNKMDGVAFSAERAATLSAPLAELAGALGLELETIPISALEGDHVVVPSDRLPWFRGPTVAQRLMTLEARPQPSAVRAAVQLDTASSGWTAVHLLSGELSPGQELDALPHGTRSAVLEVSPLSPTRVRLASAERRGTLLATPGTVAVGHASPAIVTVLEPLAEGTACRLLQSGRSTPVWLDALRKLSLETGRPVAASELSAGDVALATLRLAEPTWLTGEALLIDALGRTVAGVRFT
ncbi:MAG: GTP-binding protein [Myxococcota bacterium]